MSSTPPRSKSPKNTPGSKSPPHGGGGGGGATSGGGGTTLRLNLHGKGGSSPKRSGSPKPPGSAGSNNTDNNSPQQQQPSSTSPSNNNPKKRKYTPPAGTSPHLALASFTRVYHQVSQLSFVRCENGGWACQGESTLYVGDTAPPLPTTTQLAFHLRGTCEVESAKVQTIGLNTTSSSSKEEAAKKEEEKDAPNVPMEEGEEAAEPEKEKLVMETWKSTFDHFDPLEHVLIKPPTSYTETDIENLVEGKTKRYDADSQCSRGAAGMTVSLRAASIASTMGELRLSVDRPSNAAGRPPVNVPPVSAEEKAARRKWLADQWSQDLEATTHKLGKVGQDLHKILDERTSRRQAARRTLIAERLAESSDTDHGRRAFKVTIRYHIPNLPPLAPFHAGGLHVIPPSTSGPAHIYTTAGAFGDHEGTRSWLPCLDSASFKHRASHQITIQVTAPMREGLRVLGFGEDIGVVDTWLHLKSDKNPVRRKLMEDSLGKDHVEWIRKNFDTQQQHESQSSSSAPHVIPPDPGDSSMDEDKNGNNDLNDESKAITSIEQILATQVWASASWMPVPARSLGFAIGPFHIVEDPEYFGVAEIEEDEDETNEPPDGADVIRRQRDLDRERERIEEARLKGEGIRQAYFAPLFERKFIHVNAITTLLEDMSLTASPTKHDSNATTPMRSNVVEIQLLPMTSRQRKLSKGLEQTVLFATAGVPHRALSLMRDILALPSYRTSAYTQIWIPHAANGGSTSGALQSCPEVLGANTFLGGAIMDAGLLPPVGKRLPFYLGGGRVLQMLQARCTIRGWIVAAIPLGGQDDVGHGYIHALIEAFLMSLYERGHGGQGEGGAKGSIFYTKRYAASSGLNSMNLDFLPVRNIEEEVEVAIGGIMGAVPVEDRNNDQLWRSTSNGSESCTSSMDEFALRQVLCKDAVDALERGTDKCKYVPMPSMGWLGSHLSLSFLSSNATSSSDLGGGALELVHSTGGLVYRALKSDLLRRVVEGRAGVANFIRLVRAAFIASHLDDIGEKELKMPSPAKKKKKEQAQEADADTTKKDLDPILEPLKPKFIICVNEIIKKKGLTHTLFTRALQNMAGRIREAHLLGRLVDVERDAVDPRTKKPFIEPEGFPNSYVRGASSLYLRVGVHVEVARDGGAQAQAGGPMGVQLQTYAEPVIPEGGTAFSGPVTLRIVENEGQLYEYVKDIPADGSRRDWGTTILHAKPVTTPKAQTAASGSIETTAKDSSKAPGSGKGIFSSNNLVHAGGYQAIELIRLTNLTPLLWVRVDPTGLYGGRISVFQPDACLAEQLFHDGDAGAQVDAMRNLAERPLRIQGSVKVTTVYDVKVSELPVRLLGDCLRGSPALHSSLPHTPAVRAQAALAIAQWQNNKAPPTSNAVGGDSWIGLNLLTQYFKERFYSNGMVMPVRFTRIAIKKNEVEAAHEASAAEGGAPNPNPKEDFSYQYLDSLDEGMERATALEESEGIDVEEDEEYRVRSAVITAIASIRAKDGSTPPIVLKFMETILEGEDTEMAGNVVYPDEDVTSERRIRRGMDAKKKNIGFDDTTLSPYPYVSSTLVADSLLALCHINAFPALITDPATGKPVQSSAIHPVSKLMEISLRWLEWELYRESIRAEAEAELMSGIATSCHDMVAAFAVTALSSLAILRQSTTDPIDGSIEPSESSEKDKTEEEVEASQREQKRSDKLDEVTTVKFYTDIFDKDPPHSELTRAACAQAVACIYCAWDRFEKKEGDYPVGLLSALEFLLDRINDPRSPPSLKHTLSLLMMDACTGKICSLQRVGAIGGRNELVSSAARFYNGPLGACHGGDSGSASLMAVSPTNYPAANAVNDGARRGLRLLGRAGHPRETAGQEVVVRIARFATNLWRTINGELVMPQTKAIPSVTKDPTTLSGVCAYDGQLRCSLLALWQWVWPNRCLAVLQVQAWKSHEGTQRYEDLGAEHVMKITEEEKAAASAEESSLDHINRLVNVELERQKWRGEMAIKAHEFLKNDSSRVDVVAAEQGIGQPLPPIQRDLAFKNGGWVASAAQQRRALALDGGTAVTKLRLTVKSSD